MSDRTIAIIGGGIAGLSAGCYGRMNGFRTTLFEMHKKPGGLCTAWKRQDYVIDGCLHWLVGSAPGMGFHRIWKELGALEGRRFVDHDAYLRVEGPDGRSFTFSTDLDRLERDLLAFAPEDNAPIGEFIKACRTCLRFDPPMHKAPELNNALDMLWFLVRYFPVLRTFGVWNRISLRDFAARFRNPVLRQAFQEIFHPDFPVIFVLMTFAWLHRKEAGYPLGGSLAFARSIEKRYLDLGGEARYKARAAKVLVEHDRAVGIRLADGTEHRADYIVSAADGHATIFEMLDGKYLNDAIRSYYDNLPIFPPLVHVALGVNRSFGDVPPSALGMTIPVEPALEAAGMKHDRFWVHIYHHDPSLAPSGKTVVKVMFATDYEYWKKLREDDARYKAEKERIADAAVKVLDRRFPGLAGQVEVRDVATPTTFVRYTGNWKGSFEGWVPVPRAGGFRLTMLKSLPGLSNFYMAGQWVEPGGGVPTAALSGRNVVQLICRQEKKRFRTSQP